MKTFETPVIEVITFTAESIMTVSNDMGKNELPWDTWN